MHLCYAVGDVISSLWAAIGYNTISVFISIALKGFFASCGPKTTLKGRKNMKIEVSFTMMHTVKLPSVRIQGVVCKDKIFVCSENIQTYSLIRGNVQEIAVQIELIGWVDEEGKYHSIRMEECISFDGLEVDFEVANKPDVANVKAVVLCN